MIMKDGIVELECMVHHNGQSVVRLSTTGNEADSVEIPRSHLTMKSMKKRGGSFGQKNGERWRIVRVIRAIAEDRGLCERKS